MFSNIQNRYPIKLMYEYNEENKISKYVDKEGNITTYKYDENGNQIEVNEKQDLVITKWKDDYLVFLIRFAIP